MTTIVRWRPDDCVNGDCVIEAPGVGFPPVTFIQMCNRHQNVKTLFGLTDEQLHSVIVFSSRRREKARWETKLELALDKETMVPFFNRRDFLRYILKHGESPPPPYCRGEALGGITVVSGLVGAALTALQTRVSNALSGLETENGVSAVTVE